MSDDVYIPVKVFAWRAGALVSKGKTVWFAVLDCGCGGNDSEKGEGESRELAIEDLRRKLREEGRTE